LPASKSELNITTGDNDEILKAKIAEASSDIQAAGKRLPREEVKETFWHDDAFRPLLRVPRFGNPAQTTLFLSRTPVSAIAGVTVDDIVLDPSQVRLDPDAGLIDRLSTDGFPCAWCFCKSVIVAYTGGYILPGDTVRNLPYGIEGAVVALVSDYWASRGRDPTLRSESIPGAHRPAVLGRRGRRSRPVAAAGAGLDRAISPAGGCRGMTRLR
jgi:hypothetical protein